MSQFAVIVSVSKDILKSGRKSVIYVPYKCQIYEMNYEAVICLDIYQ